MRDKIDVEKITKKLYGLLTDTEKWKQPLNEYHIKMYKNFIRYYKKIFRLYNIGEMYGGKKSEKYQKGVKKLKLEVKENRSASWSWLIDKAERL